MSADVGFELDAQLLGRSVHGSVWSLRRARRQLMRRWAKRGRAYGSNSWLVYCEYVARDGLYGAPWVPPAMKR